MVTAPSVNTVLKIRSPPLPRSSEGAPEPTIRQFVPKALSDALPLLAKAEEVVVATMEAASETDVRDSLADVAVFLEQHGILARTEVIAGAADGEGLIAFARSVGADLIVCGAYGHSRLREWAFGGITRSLIGESGISRLFSN